MFPAERRRLIHELVLANGAVSLRELARIAQTSEVTVRRDLRHLEEAGLIARSHGGAVSLSGSAHEPTFSESAQVCSQEKAAIAHAAARTVHDGESLAIGPGTTAQAFARRLTRFSELTVVTTSLLVAQVLSRARGVEVVMPGGVVRGSIFALVGGPAEQALAGIRVDKAFLSGSGLSARHGLSTHNAGVAGVDRAIVASAREVVVLVDHTKVGVEAMMQTVDSTRISTVVTDAGTPASEVALLRASGLDVVVAGSVGHQQAIDSTSMATFLD